MLSAHNLCKQTGPRSGPTIYHAWSRSNMFDTLIVFLNEFFEKVDFEKNQQMTKNLEKHEKFPRGKELTHPQAAKVQTRLHIGKV